jgi:histidine triad (HIT) family protein
MSDSPTIFTRIINKEIPAEFLYEGERAVVIKTIEPLAPVHLLGITRTPYQDISELLDDGQEGKEALWELLQALRTLARENGVAQSGYRLSTNIGADAGQTVHHLHVHLLGGKELGASA